MRINCAGESGIVYRILIVDDEKIERTGLRLLLGKMDQKFEITEAVTEKKRWNGFPVTTPIFW